MKKREFIKSSLLGLSASALTLSGCNKETKTLNDSELKITPKQTGTYEFSVPLPFDYKTIDEIAEFNSTLKKSKITSMYNGAPRPLSSKFNQWIQVVRGSNDSIKTYDDFFRYVKYAKSKGFEFTYLMNSPKPFSHKDFLTFKDEFGKLIDLLIKYNVKNIKVANTQVATLINDFASKEFNLHASTACEYHNISQYDNLFNNYSNFTLIDVANDENQNFKFLKSLRERFPDIKIELMLNEECIKGCPARVSHTSIDNFYEYECPTMRNILGFTHYFLRTGIIYPWNLEYYSAIGINNFKYVAYGRANYKNTAGLRAYLDCVENGIDNYSVNDLFEKLYIKYKDYNYDKNIAKNTKLSKIKPLLPDIRYFITHGHECATRCGVDCNYCCECARKLEKILLYG